MSYILFTADFDESQSVVQKYETLDEIADNMDAYCEECEGYKKWFNKLVKEGYHYGEWHHYHLVEVKGESIEQ